MAFLAPFVPVLAGGAIAAGGAMLAARSAPKPPAPPKMPDPPRPEDMIDVVDKIAGVQSVNVKGADGKTRRVIDRLPRTKEEQFLYDEAGVLMKNALGTLQELYKQDPLSALNYAPLIDTVNHLNTQRAADIERFVQMPDFSAFAQDFKKMQRTVIDEEFTKAKNAKQADLTRNGYGLDSTAWANASAALDREHAEAVAKNDVNAELTARELQEKDIKNRVLSYHLGEAGRQGELEAVQLMLSAEQQELAEREVRRQRSIGEQSGLFQTGANIRKEDSTLALNNVASQVAQNMFNAQHEGYKAGILGKNAQYQNQLNAFDRRPLNFGEIAGYHIGQIGGQMTNPNTSIGHYTMGFSDWLTGKDSGQEARNSLLNKARGGLYR
jgi:hypothetical protein